MRQEGEGQEGSGEPLGGLREGDGPETAQEEFRLPDEEVKGHHGRITAANFHSRLTPRMRAAARLLSSGLKESDVCETLSFSQQYLNRMKRQDIFVQELDRFMRLREEVALDAYLEVERMNPRFIEVLKQEVYSDPDPADSFGRGRRWEIVKWGLGVQGVSPVKKQDIRSRSVNVTVKKVLDEVAERWGRHREEFG